MTQIFGHRGASGYAPENTLEAFELAANMGAEGVELDVHLSRDGVLVVAHDERIDRVSDGIGRICDMTLKELKKHTFNATHPNYQGAKMPTLEEVLALLAPTGMHVNIELKNSVYPYTGMEEQCLRLVEEMGFEERVIYSSFNHLSMVRLKHMAPKAVCGLLYDCCMVAPWEYARNLGVDALHPSYPELMFTPDACDMAHEQGLLVNTWTVNDERSMNMVYRAGADILITNFPDRALDARIAFDRAGNP